MPVARHTCTPAHLLRNETRQTLPHRTCTFLPRAVAPIHAHRTMTDTYSSSSSTNSSSVSPRNAASFYGTPALFPFTTARHPSLTSARLISHQPPTLYLQDQCDNPPPPPMSRYSNSSVLQDFPPKPLYGFWARSQNTEKRLVASSCSTVRPSA